MEKTEKKLFRAVTQMNPGIYKDFYRLYYRERFKVFNIVSIFIAAAAFMAAVFLQIKGFAAVWTALLLWICLFFLVYPHMAYRRSYKRDKDKKQTTYFSFYETYVAEKTNSEPGEYKYSELMKVIETGKYIIIFHDLESVSIVVKSTVKEGSGGLGELLKSKAPYKRMK